MIQINCNKCGYKNQSHYNKCLGCGNQLIVITSWPEPLVESAIASGRNCYITTYRDGNTPLTATLLFHDPEDATECARILTASKKPSKV